MEIEYICGLYVVFDKDGIAVYNTDDYWDAVNWSNAH